MNCRKGQLTEAKKFWNDRGDLHEAHRAAGDPSCARKQESSTLSTANWGAENGACPQKRLSSTGTGFISLKIVPRFTGLICPLRVGRSWLQVICTRHIVHC